MTETALALLKAGFALLVICGYQWWGSRRRWDFGRRMVTAGQPSNAAAQILLPGLILVVIFPLSWSHWPKPPTTVDAWVQVPLGVLVGIGELGVCGLLSTVVVSLTRREPVSEHNWMALLRSPLLAPYRRLGDQVHPIAALGILMLGATVQEFLARGVVVSAAMDAGIWPSVIASICVSCGIWTLPTGSRQTAQLGLIVGAVTGLVHGLLYWHTGSLLPLAVAQISFTALAVL
jgi:membrane protease YdiL (CAAX protease family)